MISGRSGLPKFRQLVAPIGTRAGAGDVARGLGDREHRAAARIEVAVAAVAVGRHRQRARRALHADDAGAPCPAGAIVLVRTMWSYCR